MSTDLERLKEQFFRNTEDILTNIENVLLEAESGTVGPETIDGMFRDFHTLKGNAGMVEEGDIQELCHAVESRLDPVRKGKEQLTDAIIQGVFDVVDVLRKAVQGNNPSVMKEDLQSVAAGLGRANKARVPTRPGSDEDAPKNAIQPAGGPSRLNTEEQGKSPYPDCSLEEFRLMYGFFHPIDEAVGRLSEENEHEVNSTILEEVGISCIELQDNIPEKFERLKILTLYIEKLLVLFIRNDMHYDPFSFELLHRLLSDFREEMLGILKKGDFMLEVPIPNMRSLSYLEEVIDAGKEILIVRLLIPYEKFVSHEASFQLLKRLYSTQRHYVIFVLASEETVSKAVTLVKDSVEDFPQVYDSIWSGLQELLQTKKELTDGQNNINM